jgi:hypothetical protein
VIEIKEHIATEELLKIYFFKLYARKNEFVFLHFLEEALNDIINCKTLSQMNSKELFDCIKIERRGFGFDSCHESFNHFIPSKFYFIDDIGNSKETIFEHPFLYTNFKLIDGLNLYEAEVGLNSIGCDLINSDGAILNTVAPNLYDDGYYVIKVLSKKHLIFLLIITDENNGDWLGFYSLKNNQLIEVDEVGDKSLILEFLKSGCTEILAKASLEINDDEEILMAAVKIDSSSLIYASERLRNDKTFLLKAVSQDGSSLQYASEELQNDREVAIAAVSNYRYALIYVGEKLKYDADILAIANIQNNNNITNSDNLISDDLPF